MDTATERGDCTQEAARLLPWHVNGSLSASEARQVAGHLAQCAVCRADAAALAQVRTLLRAPAQVEHAPHAGLQKLLARIDAAERAEPPAPARAAPATARARGGPVRWLAAALAAQSMALVAIGGAMLFGRPAADAPPQFRTLTTADSGRAALRVVFMSTMTLGEVQELLRANRLVVLAGPTGAGLFTLGLQTADDRAPDVEAALARLRADPRVRFAEPLPADADAR